MCGGCQSDINTTEYFCSGSNQYIYFRCESNSFQLIWDVFPLFQTPVILGATSDAENIIRRDSVDILVDTVDLVSPRIISHLWLNLRELNSDVNVSCSNGQPKWKTLKLLGMILVIKLHHWFNHFSILSIDTVKAPSSVTAALFSNSKERVVFYQWNHDNPETILCYNAMTYNENTLISNITLPSGSVNGSSNVTKIQGNLRLEIEAVGLCHHTAKREIDVMGKYLPLYRSLWIMVV